MTPQQSQNSRNLQLIRGDLPARSARRARFDAPDAWLDREMQAAFADLCGGKGTSPGIYAAAEGYRHPWRVLARRLRDARRAQQPHEKAIRVLRVFERYIDRLYGLGLDRAA